MADKDLQSDLIKIIEAIDAELYNAIACAETLKPILYDKDITQKFLNTYAAHILNYLQQAIHRDGISCVWRMWDPAGDSNSIPALIAKLENADILDAIKDRRRASMLNISNQVGFMDHGGLSEEAHKEIITKMAEKDAGLAVIQVDKDFADIKKLIAAKELNDLLERSKQWRDRHVAHNTELTRKERKAGVKADPLKWGEFERIVELTSEIFVLLRVLVEDLSIFPKDIHDHYQQYSAAFWAALKDEIK